MTDAKVAAIRTRRNHGYWGEPGDGYQCVQAEADVDYLLAALEQAHKALADIEELTPTEQPTQPDPTGVYGYRLYVAGTVARAALKAGDV